MKNHNNRSLRCLVLLITLILPVSLSANQHTQESQSTKSVNKTEKTEQQNHAVPGLSDIIPEATALSGRFAALKKVREALESVCNQLDWASSHHKPVVSISGFGDSAVNFKTLVWIENPWDAGDRVALLNEAIWWGLKCR